MCAWNGMSKYCCHLSKKDCQGLVLLKDKLKRQVQVDFKAAVFSESGFLWYSLPEATNLW